MSNGENVDWPVSACTPNCVRPHRVTACGVTRFVATHAVRRPATNCQNCSALVDVTRCATISCPGANTSPSTNVIRPHHISRMTRNRPSFHLAQIELRAVTRRAFAVKAKATDRQTYLPYRSHAGSIWARQLNMDKRHSSKRVRWRFWISKTSTNVLWIRNSTVSLGVRDRGIELVYRRDSAKLSIERHFAALVGTWTVRVLFFYYFLPRDAL